MEDSYIKIFRKIQEWEWFKDSETLHLFIYLLLNANFKPSRFMGHEIPRGCIVTGLNSLNENTGISVQSLRTRLERLKSTREITSKSTNKFTIITICNYDSYQSEKIKSTSKSTNDQQATNIQLTTSEEVKKERRKEVKKEVIEIPSHLKEIWPSFLEMRKGLKKYPTDKAQELLFNKLNKLSPDLNIQVKIVEQSVENSYQGLFPLKEQYVFRRQEQGQSIEEKYPKFNGKV